jgi:Uma2 family endonuclease
MTLVEPDMLFVHRDRISIVTEREVSGAPDLVIEVLSPGTARPDRGRKRALYQDEAISEYWIVDADKNQIEVWRPGAMEARVERQALTWPDPSVEPVAIPLPELFRD